MANRSIGCVCSFLVAVWVLSASPAGAQVLGNSGDAVFGAERLFGIRNEHVDVEDTGQGGESTTISLGVANVLLPENLPRLSFDYLAARKFSIGGAIGYSTSDADRAGGPSLFAGERKMFIFTGRVGFLHMFGRVLGIWPRGGVSYHSISIGDGATKDSQLGLALECMFPIVVAPHFGFLTGPSLDQSLTGSYRPGGSDRDFDLETRSIGWQFGLFGWI